MRQGRGEAGSSSAGEAMNGSNERNPRLQSGRIKNFYDRHMEVLRCTGCGQTKLMSTHAIFHQEQYVQAVERFASQHEHCGLSGRALHDLIWGRVVSIMQGRRAQARVT